MDMTFGSLFAGIGGFDIGFEAAGMKCLWQVEIDPFASKVLEKHWPSVERFRDIREFYPKRKHRVDVICGGFPCQDISLAGKGGGLHGERSGLWSEYFRVLGILRPRYVVVENSSALLGRGIYGVLGDLAQLGYDAEWQSFFASDFGLPHRRKRIFIVAYPHKIIRGKRTRLGSVENGTCEVFAADATERTAVRVQTSDQFVGMDDGLSRRVYSHRASAVGNAVVTHAAEWVARRIIDHSRKCGADA